MWTIDFFLLPGMRSAVRKKLFLNDGYVCNGKLQKEDFMICFLCTIWFRWSKKVFTVRINA